jgi:uncharacterized protein
MKKFTFLFLIVLSVLSKAQTITGISESFLKKLVREQFDSCFAFFDTSITSEFTPEMMQAFWQKLPQYVGEYRSYEAPRTEKEDTLDIVLILCSFEKMKLDLKFAFNSEKKIVGFFFVPPKSKTAYALPDYYETSKQYESKLSIKTGTMELPGVLCVPNNISDPPVVILVAGSGPNDKDETIGANKPLKDIALGLGANGIASFRYDKRTKVYGKDMKDDKTGINEEVIDDAVNAVKLLRAHPLTKNSKIFVAGHSLGAFCAPMIASKSKDVSAIILLAGPARPLEDLIVDQYEYLAAIDTADRSMKEALPEIKQKAARVKDPDALKKAEPKDLPFEIPVYYWQSLAKYKQVKTAVKLKQPILILQGERDYQVVMKDFYIWKKELEGDPKNKFISYPGLNHLFIKGEGKSFPGEYQISGNVEHKVVLDIAEFIKGVK